MNVNSLPKTASRLRFEPGPFCAWVQRANHSATKPLQLEQQTSRQLIVRWRQVAAGRRRSPVAPAVVGMCRQQADQVAVVRRRAGRAHGARRERQQSDGAARQHRPARQARAPASFRQQARGGQLLFIYLFIYLFIIIIIKDIYIAQVREGTNALCRQRWQ